MIVLDTHALVWWVEGGKLSQAAATAIADEQPDGEILVSSITAWELALLVRRGRLRLALDVSDWLAAVGRVRAVRYVPVDNKIALASVALPDSFDSDPADRIIVATARSLGAALVTADDKIRGYPHIRTVW